LSKVGDGLAVARHGQRMLFLVIPSSHLDTDLTGGVRSQHLPKVPSDSADLKEPYSESKYEYAFKEGLSDAVFAVMEGESEQVLSRRLKRSAELRDAYVKKHGYACSACKIVLSDVYGLAAKSLIEVHHLRPLAERQGEADATTLEELVGLCPNCHRVAHRRTPVYSVQEIKEFLAVARKRKAD
jgi:predicted HNH restriction endonuclease